MGKVLIVGCGGVASVAVHKCCQNSKVFDAICIASRTVSKCEALKEKLQASYSFSNVILPAPTLASSAPVCNSSTLRLPAPRSKEVFSK